MSGLVLTPAEALDAGAAGGKAAALAALLSAGFNTPRFVVLTPAAFADGALTQAARAALAAPLQVLGLGPFALRCSPLTQPRAEQRLALLNVAPQDVPQAAARVSAAFAMQSAAEAGDTSTAPAVIVQTMITPRAAGVAYSADPVTGERSLVVIAAIAGQEGKLLGTLAGDDADSQTYVFNTATDKEVSAPQNERLLSGADVRALAAMARGVEAARGEAQDIDWAIVGGETFLLQARPITTATRPPQRSAERFAVFDNSKVSENYPGVVSPLTFSFAQYAEAQAYRTLVLMLGVSRARVDAAGPIFAGLLERINGRVYANLANWYRVVALLPGYRLNPRYFETLMGVSQPLERALADKLSPPARIGLFGRLADYACLLRACVCIARVMITLRRTVIHFRRRVDSVLALGERSVAALPIAELASEYRRIQHELLDRWDAPLANDFVCLTAARGSRKLFRHWFGRRGVELHDDALIGQGDIVAAEPSQRIRAIAQIVAGRPDLLAALQDGNPDTLRRHPALYAELSHYLSRFGDRCAGELKFESIPLTLEPQPLFAAILAATEATRQPPPAALLQGSPYQRLAALCDGRPLRRRVAQRVLRFARARVRDRESLRFERTLIFAQVRRLFLAMGARFCQRGWIDDPRDVLALTVTEALSAADGKLSGGELRRMIAGRGRELSEASNLPDPPERIMRGTPLAFRQARSPLPSQSAGDVASRKGAGCSYGMARGRACVIDDPHSQSLERGDILVARHADSAWIALFTNASGIVVERGGLLSNAAIVSREMGIPCVAALVGATTWLKTGDVIEVDGSSGLVRRLAADAAPVAGRITPAGR